MKNLIKFYVTAYINVVETRYIQIVGTDYISNDIVLDRNCTYRQLEAEILVAIRSIKKDGQNFSFVINEEDEFMGTRVFKPADDVRSDTIAENGRWKTKLTNEERVMFSRAFSSIVRL